MMIDELLSALVNIVLLFIIPFAAYFAYHRLRHERDLGEIAKRAGLQLGDTRYIGYSFGFAILVLAILAVWSPPLEGFTREDSPQQPFVGLGLGIQSVSMALLYGVIKTGFTEEFFFRGLIAGSLSRRLPFWWANLIQAFIFLLPHLLVLAVMPEFWPWLILIYAGALFLGWARIRSESIFGPWLIHATLNVVTCLTVAVKTAE